MNQKLREWLLERGILLEESFTQSLVGLAMDYQQRYKIRNLDEVYQCIGIRKQLIAYWRNNPLSAQTKKF